MSILVVCPGCRKSFQVDEKFAGKTGACPKCKHAIKVPEKSDEVKVHEPVAFASGGRTKTGKLITKPIARQIVRLNPLRALLLLGAIAAVAAATYFAGHAGLLQGGLQQQATVALGLLLVTPPLVLAGYAFLRDDELEPFRGLVLWIRCGICAVVYVLLWGLLIYTMHYFPPTDIWMWVIIGAPLILLGALAAFASLDMDYGNAALHFSFYLLATVLLRWVGGMGWLWNP